MTLIEKFSLLFAAILLAQLKHVTEAADNGMRGISRVTSLKNRPFYGNQPNPAKSCKEIFKQMPNLPSGVYWLNVFDELNNKTVQERHYCKNTSPNETRTGYNFKGQQGEIGIENLSLGKPKEPFDWEELTDGNWPLPITPPTEEEMRQRLQKQIQAYRIKMKNQNPGKFGSSLIDDSRNNTFQASAQQGGGVQANVASVQSIEGENLTVSKENKPTGFSQSDYSLIGSFAKNGRIMNKTDVKLNSVDTIQDINPINPIKSETSKSWSKENPVNYTSQGLNDTSYTPSQLSRYSQSVKGSQGTKDNKKSLHYNLQNPDYSNIYKDNAGLPSQSQDHLNQQIAFRNRTKSDDYMNPKLSSTTEKSSTISNDSTMQGLLQQEMKQSHYTESSRQDLNNPSNLENRNYSISENLTINGSITTDNLKSDQPRIADYYNSTPVASSTYNNSSLYSYPRQKVVGNTTSSSLLDQNQFVNSSYQTSDSITPSDSTASVIANERFDRNPHYNLNRSFAILHDSQNLHQNRSDGTIHTDELISPVDNSRYVNKSTSDAMNETTVQIGVGLNGNKTSEYLTAWYRANPGSITSRSRNNSLITNFAATAPYLSADNRIPDSYFNQEQAANDSLYNASYALASNQGNSSLSAFSNPTNETSAQLSNLKLDQNRNLDDTYLNNSVGVIANSPTADNIRSNQYWNPGYGNLVGKQSNESSSDSDEIRSDLYWNPGYANNRSIDLQSNESNLNPQSYYLQSSSTYWNRSSVLETFDRSTNGTTDAFRIVKENYSSSDVVVVVNSTSTNRSKDTTLSYYNSLNGSAYATSYDSAGNLGVSTNNETISASNEGNSVGIQSVSEGIESASAGIESASAGNQSASGSNQTISTPNESSFAGITNISASIHRASAGDQGASANNITTSVSDKRASADIQSMPAGDESAVASSSNLGASNKHMSVGTQNVSAGNRSIYAGSQFAESMENVSNENGYENVQKSIHGISSYDIGNTSGSINTSTINGEKVQSNATAMENESDLLLRNADTFYKQTNDSGKAAATTIARAEIIGRRHNLLQEKNEKTGHSRVRMILKNWSKITSADNKEEKMMNLNMEKGTTTEKDALLTKKNGAAGKDISYKDMERDGLFVKPGLNIGVIETTKDLKNESKRKDTVVKSKNKPITIPVSVVEISSQSSPDSKRTVVLHSNGPAIGETIPEDAPVYTGQVTNISFSPAGDPVKKPNPDELHRGLWTDEAIKYTEKANEDYAKQMKYLSEHGGKMDELIWEYNKLNGNKQATRDPKNADDTKEKMKDFFARNKEIVSKGGGPESESSKNREENSTPNNGKQYIKVSGLKTPKDNQDYKPDSSLKLGLSSTASSEAGSESQTEAWADVGANTESLTGVSSDSEPAEEEFEDGNSQWDSMEEPSYEEYDRPQGLGLWTDSNTGTGVGISIGPDDGTNPDAESEFESKDSSKNSWPGFGFSTGFGMGMNAGSQSGSQTMTETSVAVNTGTSAETSSKTESEGEANSGSKSKSKYKWKMEPKINSFNEQTNGYTEKSNGGVHQGNMNPKEMANIAGGDLDAHVAPISQTVKEKAKFRPNPQLGIQVDSSVNTKVHASASAQPQPAKSTGKKKKPKLKPKTASQISMEKAKERLRKQMKNFKEDLEAKTRDNPLHRWKLFGKTPLQGRLEAIAEKTRNIPLGIRVGETNSKETGTGNPKDVHKEPSTVEASVDIKYEGKNTTGVNIEAGVSTNIGGGESRPKNDTLKDIKGINNHKDKKNWRNLYKWYEKYPFNIPSVAEINKKLNSMPYALYKVRMRKFSKRDV